jgi:hypothetical protein
VPNYADAGYDHRQLDHLVRHRLHSLQSLKCIKYVRGTTGHPFDEEFLSPISQYANCNDDVFAFAISSQEDRGSEQWNFVLCGRHADTGPDGIRKMKARSLPYCAQIGRKNNVSEYAGWARTWCR